MKALIIVDPQIDFFDGGSLEVKNSLSIIPNINYLIENGCYDYIIISKDYHPSDHVSFASTHNTDPFTELVLTDGSVQMLWTDHCVRDTIGSNIHPDIKYKSDTIFITKGENPNVDSYSAFYDNNGAKLELSDILKKLNVSETHICGLAMDYCCLYTALDSVKEGFDTSFIINATAPVFNDITNAMKQLIDNEVKIIYCKII